MEKRIVYIDPLEGSIRVVIPAYNDRSRPAGETENELLERASAGAVPNGISHVIVDEVDIPSDRTFREAWEWRDSIKVNIPKARLIHMNRIRKVRDAQLTKLDVTFMRAIEASDMAEQQRFATLKQLLRDIPQTFDLTKYRTQNTLKAAWPPELPPMPVLIPKESG